MHTSSQIIYVENEYNDEINDFLMHHWDTVQVMAQKKGLEFVYIPKIFKDISSSGNRFEELVQYYFPFSKEPVIGSPKLDYFTTPFFTNYLLPKLGYVGGMSPGLIRFADNAFSDYMAFDLSGRQSIEEQCHAYFSKYPDAAPEEIEPKQEENVLEKIISRREELQELGIYEILLKEIGAGLNEQPQKPKKQPNNLSRLVIDRDYRIWLPDYNDKEIKMTPLPKALYLLFLRHREGISLKYMSDHKRELTNIYKQISYRESFESINQSIDRLCMPTDNSINEKLSRIREAFVKTISNEYAQHYYISGERGGIKRIKIKRELVDMNCM